jgi:hypothetical protein
MKKLRHSLLPGETVGLLPQVHLLLRQMKDLLRCQEGSLEDTPVPLLPQIPRDVDQSGCLGSSLYFWQSS